MAGWQPQKSANLEAKDWSYEFGITLGAARGNIERTGDMEKDLDTLFEEVRFMLKAKSDPRFIELFNKYWPHRPRLGVTPQPTAAASDKIRILS